jgi:hypothetical protein
MPGSSDFDGGRKGEPRARAWVAGDIFHFGTDGSCHGVDNPRPKSRALRRGVCATSDAIILDNEFGALVGYPL